MKNNGAGGCRFKRGRWKEEGEKMTGCANESQHPGAASAVLSVQLSSVTTKWIWISLPSQCFEALEGVKGGCQSLEPGSFTPKMGQSPRRAGMAPGGTCCCLLQSREVVKEQEKPPEKVQEELISEIAGLVQNMLSELPWHPRTHKGKGREAKAGRRELCWTLHSSLTQ